MNILMKCILKFCTSKSLFEEKLNDKQLKYRWIYFQSTSRVSGTTFCHEIGMKLLTVFFRMCCSINVSYYFIFSTPYSRESRVTDIIYDFQWRHIILETFIHSELGSSNNRMLDESHLRSTILMQILLQSKVVIHLKINVSVSRFGNY